MAKANMKESDLNNLRAENMVLVLQAAIPIRPRFANWLDEMEDIGSPCKVVEVFRSAERQTALFKAGLTKYRTGGPHCGFTIKDKKVVPASTAMDFVPADTRGWTENPLFFATAAVVAHRNGLMTGLLFDLPPLLRMPRLKAIETGDIGLLADLVRNGKRGWDPQHLQAGRFR